MECREISDLMMKYIDGDISCIEQERLNAHIKSCGSCSLEFQLLKDTVFLVEELPELDLPETFDAKVMEVIRAEEAYTKGKSSTLLGIGIIGLIAFVCYLGIFVTLPFIIESGIMNPIAGYISMAFSFAIEKLTSALIATLLFIGKMFTLRDLLINQYLNIINIALIVVLLNMIVYRAIKYQHE